MIAWLAFYAGLSAVSLTAVGLMLRDPRYRSRVPEPQLPVPDYTFDPRGFV